MVNKKKYCFTIIELLVALGLFSILVSFLFVFLKTTFLHNVKTKKEAQVIIEREKSYIKLKSILDRIDLDLNAEIKDQVFYFYFKPDSIDCEQEQKLFIGNLKQENSKLFLQVFNNEKKHLYTIYLIDTDENFNMYISKSPKSLHINTSLLNWIFFLDKNHIFFLPS